MIVDIKRSTGVDNMEIITDTMIVKVMLVGGGRRAQVPPVTLGLLTGSASGVHKQSDF